MFKENFAVYCIKYAESVLPESMAFLGASKEKVIPISFAVYLIKTKNKNILVDVGCNTMPGFDMKKHQPPAVALRSVGFAADEITDVIITHAHHDHIEALRYFKNAVLHITEDEYSNGKKYIPENMPVHLWGEELLIEEQIKVIKWGGHSIGSAIVEMTYNDEIHILAGDECYTDLNIKNKICTGTFYDKAKSIEFVEKYSNKKYCVHTCHDISLKTERII